MIGLIHRDQRSDRPAALSIPYVTLVVFDSAAFEHQAELVLKRSLPVVFLLIGYVRFHLFDVGRADGKHAIVVLPVEAAQGYRVRSLRDRVCTPKAYDSAAQGNTLGRLAGGVPIGENGWIQDALTNEGVQ